MTKTMSPGDIVAGFAFSRRCGAMKPRTSNVTSATACAMVWGGPLSSMRRGFHDRIEAGTGAAMGVRENQKSRPKDDLSWSEVGEMAYGYLRIPVALVFVEIVLWATEPDASWNRCRSYWLGCGQVFQSGWQVRRIGIPWAITILDE